MRFEMKAKNIGRRKTIAEIVEEEMKRLLKAEKKAERKQKESKKASVPELLNGGGWGKLRKGDEILCPICDERHVLEPGTREDDGSETEIMLFYRCGSDVYLGAVHGMPMWRPKKLERKQESECA